MLGKLILRCLWVTRGRYPTGRAWVAGLGWNSAVVLGWSNVPHSWRGPGTERPFLVSMIAGLMAVCRHPAQTVTRKFTLGESARDRVGCFSAESIILHK